MVAITEMAAAKIASAIVFVSAKSHQHGHACGLATLAALYRAQNHENRRITFVESKTTFLMPENGHLNGSPRAGVRKGIFGL